MREGGEGNKHKRREIKKEGEKNKKRGNEE